MAAYQMFDFEAQSVSKEVYPTLLSTEDNSVVMVQVDIYSNRDGSVTSLIRTLIDGQLFFNRKPVTYSSFGEANGKLEARMSRTIASMMKKAAANHGNFPRSRR